MCDLKYLDFDDVNPSELMDLLNNVRVRRHLVEHEEFTIDNLTKWMESKKEINDIPGCRVQGVIYKSSLVGWCGIQHENNQYEFAIILDDKFWGLGKRIFKDMMQWAKEMRHTEITINFLHSRPEYKFLKNAAISVYETEIFGHKFLCYQLPVK